MQYDVFISHSSKDKELAREIYEYLKSNGIRPWIDFYDIPSGTKYARAIIDGIKNSRVILIILSENANDSENIINEVDNAHNLRKEMLPFHIDRSEMCEELQYYLSRWQRIEAHPHPEEKFKDILEYLEDSGETGEAEKEQGKLTRIRVYTGKHKIGCSVTIIIILLACIFVPFTLFEEQTCTISYSPPAADVPDDSAFGTTYNNNGSTNSIITQRDKDDITFLIKEWDELHNSLDSNKVKIIYASIVDFYGQSLTKQEIYKKIKDSKAAEPTYQQESGRLSYHVLDNGDVQVNFVKSTYLNGKRHDYPGLITVKRSSKEFGWTIIEETDLVTIRNQSVQQKADKHTSENTHIIYGL